jgi:hypothetical protein
MVSIWLVRWMVSQSAGQIYLANRYAEFGCVWWIIWPDYFHDDGTFFGTKQGWSAAYKCSNTSTLWTMSPLANALQ